MVLSTVLPGILLLGIVIFFHELGHFLAAKWRGVTVIKFSLGMGPEIVGFTAGGTRYCFSWIPLGGFVQMAGDHPNDDGSMPEGGPEQFLTHPWYGRVIIAIAGPAANLVTAYVVMVVMCLMGLQQPDYPNVLGELPDSTAAYSAGLREGDRIVQASGRDVKTWHDFTDAVDTRDVKRPLGVVVERDGQRVVLEVPGERARQVLGALQPPASLPLVGAVVTGMPAYRAGIQEGDRVVSIDGTPIRRFDQMRAAMHGKVDQVVHVRVMRAGKPLDVSVTPISDAGGHDRASAVIGIEPPRGMIWVEHFTPVEAIRAGARGTLALVGSVYSGMWMTVSRPLYYREYVGGPIFIAQMARDSAKKGLDNYLYFLAMINIAIMAFNLMPIPLLDGGHIVLAVLEAIRRRGISAQAYLNFQKVGLVLVGTLFVLILSKDILRPFQRLRALDRAPRETTTVAPTPH